MWSAAPLLKTGTGLLFAYWIYFLMNGMLKIFFGLELRVWGPVRRDSPICRSGSYFSKGEVSTASLSTLDPGPSTDRGCERLSWIGVPSSTPGGKYRCIRRTWSAMVRSRFSSTSSVTMKSKSKRERRESGRAMFLWGSLWISYCQYVSEYYRLTIKKQYLAIYRVRCSHDTTPSVQARVDACLSNRDCLLFHYFVNSNSINI